MTEQKDKYFPADHVFAVCAYGESPYLKNCVLSLLKQTKGSRVVLCTSTPNAMIREIAETFHLPLFINEGAGGIAGDWNFAYRSTDRKLVTLAHQDDIYQPGYLEAVLEAVNRAEKPLIAFTDYYEIKNGRRVSQNLNLNVKRIMLAALRCRRGQKSRLLRRSILSFGSPICCPSVTYVRENLPETVFEDGFHADLDWQAWERISRMSGEFCFIPKLLMGHRIHEGSETSRVIASPGSRSAEDLEMFRRFWPAWMASFLNRLYSFSQKGNKE